MTQEPHNLQGNDVVRISVSSNFVIPHTTFISSYFLASFCNQCKGIQFSSAPEWRYKWFISGMDCEVLKPNQNWQKGKVRIGLVFIPDVDEEEEPSEESPLDEIRKIAKDGA